MQAAQEETIMIKGKRSKRPRPSSPLALTMATSSCSTAELSGGGIFSTAVISDVSGSSDHRVNPSPSNSGGFTTYEDEEDMANCLILLAKGQRQTPSPPVATAAPMAAEVYQCKTCNKRFASFQALGGHRASHKKPNSKSVTLDYDKKPSKNYKQDDFQSNRDDSTVLSLQISNRVMSSNQNKPRVHECSICGAEFASGQALGGHMRRHRPIAVAPTTSHGGESQEVTKKPRNLLSLDLNLPAPEDDHRESKFPFAPKEQLRDSSLFEDDQIQVKYIY
ncbi:hypothetical protein BUALT_Bualt09G0082400 [Buddleja alternifolia]|uniref:C2H2-type domain-containing protein n=1 Tax=Buddleja alternifolia TaxID=168488 RepID=A0AAV6XBT1_9LAMI|nr:hypothetical protein BUALT_Bualt09G0082400 [Buddleja alternifolia]